MKRLTVALVILAAVLALGVTSLMYTKQVTRDMTQQVEQIRKEAQPESIKKLNTEWKKREKLLALYTRHNELENISAKVAVLEQKAKAYEAKHWDIACEELLAAIEHLEETEKPTLRNIL